jgi:hypothetical protein
MALMNISNVFIAQIFKKWGVGALPFFIYFKTQTMHIRPL